MTYAVGFGGFVTVQADSPQTAEQAAKDLVTVLSNAAVIEWEPAIPYESCDVPGCECPSVTRVATGRPADPETGYVDEIDLCEEHAR